MLLGLRMLPENVQEDILKMISEKIKESRRKNRNRAEKTKNEWL